MPVNLDNMLLTACKNGQKGIVQAFLKKGGLQLDKRDGQGATPLHYASAKGSRDIVKLLLDAGADASIADNQSRTALHLACQVGNKDSPLYTPAPGRCCNDPADTPSERSSAQRKSPPSR